MVIKYRPEIDGIRTIAVIPVILFHMGFAWIRGGFYGVDVFFVISGFLITSNIVKNLKESTFSFREFWLRRVNRILPALYTMILVVIMLSPFFAFKGDIGSIVRDSIPALLSYSNFHALYNFGNYWGGSAEQSFFLHCWSLSVEEQFYLFYPTILFLLFKYKLPLAKWVLGIIILSFVLFFVGVKKYPLDTFYMLHTRAWELAVGSLIAVVHRRTFPAVVRNIVSIMGLFMILIGYFVKGQGSINIYAVLPVVGTACIIYCTQEADLLGKLLSNKVMVFIGKISYSLYLWHWPIIVFSKYYIGRIPSFYLYIIIVVAIAVMSLLSYYLVEKTTRRSWFTPRLVLSIGVVTISLGFYLNSSAYNNTYDSPFNKVVFYGLFYDISPQPSPVTDIAKAKRADIIAPQREDKYKESYKHGGMIFGSNDHVDPEIVVIGDSHGAMWAKTIHEISDSLNSKVSFYTSVGNAPFFDVDSLDLQKATKGFTMEQRIEFAKDCKLNLDQWKPKLVIFACRWEVINSDEWHNFEKLLDLLANSNTLVLLLNQPPRIDIFKDKNSAQYFTFMGFKPLEGKKQYIEIINNKSVEKANHKLKALVDRSESFYVLDVNSKFLNGSKAMIVDNRDIMYYDDDHLSYQGTLLAKQELLGKVRSMIR